ncbi:MAG: 2-oxo acid dehydrogenase subunit E2 [Candidatus Eisenbacteria bacterium]|nr:2-oxo acid dehydrogenase subunit E2 [Candidatus Eisenbacteria bacterium]
MDVTLPELGEGVTEATLIKWLVKEGDRVEKDDPLFEISTDKVDAEIPSPAAGVMGKIVVAEGAEVKVGERVAALKTEGAEEAEGPAEAPQKGAGPAPAPPEKKPSEAPVAKKDAPPKPAEEVHASPLARNVAREHGVDLAAVSGTGRAGRITKEDVLARVGPSGESGAAAQPPKGDAPPAPAPPSKPEEASTPTPPSVSDEEGSRLVPMTKMRKLIAEHMVRSKQTSPHVTTVFEIDMTRVQSLRAKYKKIFEERHGARPTITAFVAHAAVPAILEFPVMNASVEGDAIRFHKSVNIGVAVALEDGLIVPVIRNAERMGLGDVARALADLSGRARAGRLKPEEVRGATFTVTNPGPYGALFCTPVINQPNAAILCMGGVKKRPVVTCEEAIAVHEMAYFSLTFDHRLIDGAVADRFMARFQERIENLPEEVMV